LKKLRRREKKRRSSGKKSNPEVSLTAIEQVFTVLPKILGDFLSAKLKCPNYTNPTKCMPK